MLLGAVVALGNARPHSHAVLACLSACVGRFGSYLPWKKRFSASLLHSPVPALRLVPPLRTRGCPPSLPGAPLPSLCAHCHHVSPPPLFCCPLSSLGKFLRH